MNTTRLAPFAMFAVLLSTTTAAAYQASQGPTELLFWDPSTAFEGYTLFAAQGTTYLVNMSGSVVHSWKFGTNPKLLANGHVLDASQNNPSGFPGFQEADWDGNVVWQYTEKRTDYAPHHDFIRIHNPKLNADTTMYIANRTITNAQALAAGADPARAPKDADKAQVDAVVEVDSTGTVVWEWWFLDHLVQDANAAWPNYVGAGKTVAAAPGRLDVNLPGRPLAKDWLHCNGMDYNQELDQVVVNAVGGEFYVIDHGGTFVVGDPAASIAAAATTKGDFLYRFGDPARYKQGDPPSVPENWTTASSGHKQIGGSHGVNWIEAGLPGAGHFLVFNNGQFLFEMTNQSYADEIDPYLGADGKDVTSYVNPPDAGYTIVTPPKDTGKVKKNQSKQISWLYGTQSPSGMASHIGGSAQRLPNGNTLICADTEGHFMEVTSTGALAWEYISPVLKDHSALKVMPDSVPMTNSVFRAYRFAPDHPAFTGRTLTPVGLITAIAPAPAADGSAETAEAPADDAVVPVSEPQVEAPAEATIEATADVLPEAQADATAEAQVAEPEVCQCPPTSKGCLADPAGAAGGATWLLLAGALAAAGALRRRGARAG